MTNNLANILNLLVAWLLYFGFHSSLASLRAKNWTAAHWPRFTPYYRLAYNLLATVLLIPPLWLVHLTAVAIVTRRDFSFLGGLLRWGFILALVAIVAFWWSLRYYDMGEFLGIRRVAYPGQDRRLALSPFHRFVRHPWYCFGLVIIWTRDMDPAWLASCLLITLYFAVGSRLEERKLVVEFGAPYRRYQQRVPALFPLPGQYLSRTEAEGITATAKRPPG